MVLHVAKDWTAVEEMTRFVLLTHCRISTKKLYKLHMVLILRSLYSNLIICVIKL